MGLQLRTKKGGWPIFALHHSHGGCPILAFFARACPELVEGVGGDAAGVTFVRSTLPVVYAVVVPALRKVREGRGTRSCGGFCSLKAGPPAGKIRGRKVGDGCDPNSDTYQMPGHSEEGGVALS